MLIRKITRLCAVLVLSGVSSVAVSIEFNFGNALQYLDEDGTIVITDNFDSIKENTFANINVKKVVIPNSFSTIPWRAFAGSTVEEVVLPNSVIEIERDAFLDASKLRKIVLSSTLKYIRDEAFKGTALTEIILPESLESIGNNAFVGVPLTELQLPEGVNIAGYAFSGHRIKHLKIPNNTILGAFSFSSAGGTKSLEIGFNVTSPGNYGSQKIFGWGMGELRTIISYSPYGCSGGDGGLCVYSSTNLETVVLKAGTITNNPPYYIADGGARVFVGPNFNNDQYEWREFGGSEIVFIDSFTIDTNLAGVPHSKCTSVDEDLDGHSDCYDQFPNDPDRWFDYGETSDADAGGVDSSSSGLVHSDSDGLADIFDTYPTTVNMEGFGEDKDQSGYELDTDYDGINNHYDIDDDDDGLIDIYEPFFGTNPLIPDSDFDGTLDGLDAFPLDNTESLDTDSDGIGNNADTDDDGDGHFDLLDAFPLDATEWMDSDLDGVGNNADTDDDNDGVLDEEDAFPYTASESVDTDGDGVGDNSDAFPNDSSETLDTDLDGIGNNADGDDDNDGVADAEDSDPLNDSIGALESQNIFVMGNPVAVNGYLITISVGYDVSDANNQLNGIGFRVHYDSSIYNYSAVQNTLGESVVVDGMGPYQDVEDFDNDSTTDSYLVYGWAAVSGDWPNVELPAKLSDIEFFVNWADYDAASTTSNINFTVVDNNEGYDGEVTNYSMNVLPATWDFDGNGSGDALTDGLMLLRYTFGVTDLNMTTDAIAENATLSATQVVEGMTRALQITDIDGNGSTDALTDGLLLLRYMFGLRGDALILDTVSSDATRTSVTDIEQYISLYMPDGLSSPVQSEQSFIVGDWKLEKIPERKENYPYDGLSNWGPLPSWRGFDQTVFDTCVADDIYRFGINGSFEYLLNGSTFMDPEINPSDGDGGCISPPAPWNENDVYSFSIDEDSNLLTVIGTGAYVGLSNVANGIDDIEGPNDAPESIDYIYTIISNNQVILEIDAWSMTYRYTLERVLGN